MARLFWRFMLLTLKNVALSDRPKLNCSVTAATSQHFKVGNCAAKLLPRASKAAQRFCIPLQLELSCYLASKMLLNSCNLAVQQFWSDFVALYSAASFVRGETSLLVSCYWFLLLLGDCQFREEKKCKLNAWSKWQVYMTTWQMHTPNVECTRRTREK